MRHCLRLRARWLFLVLGCAVFISGCAIQLGAPFKTDQVPSIQVGKTTQAEVMGFFGQPTSRGVKDGRPLWTYLFARLSLGGTATGTLLSIEFDDQGVVHGYSYVPY